MNKSFQHPAIRSFSRSGFAFLLGLTALSSPGFAEPSQSIQVETAEETVKVKESKLEKTKWEKIKYNRFVERRKDNALPLELSAAPLATLRQDKTLPPADLTGYFVDPDASSTLMTALDELVVPIPNELPDINLLFSGSDQTNATATGTGQVVIYAGIEKLEYMDELLFLLAHEVSHIAFDHFKNEETRETLNSLAVLATYAAKGGDTRKTETSDELIGALIFSESILGPSWGRGDEEDADELAIDMLVRAGYSTDGAQAFLNKLVKAEDESERKRKQRCEGTGGGLFSALGMGPPPPPECNAFKRLFSGLFRSHAKASKRKEHLQKYIATRYPAYVPPEPRELPTALSDFFAPTGPLGRSALAKKALEAFEIGENEEAIRFAIAAFDEKDARTPAPRLARYYHMKLVGDIEEARKQLRVVYGAGTAPRGMYLILLDEILSEARQIQAGYRQDQYQKRYQALAAQYSENPDQAIADALAVEDEREKNALAANSKSEPEKKEELSEQTIAKYEEALALIQDAKSRFPGHIAEFTFKEIDILAKLERFEELSTLVASCQRDTYDTLRDKCKNTAKAI